MLNIFHACLLVMIYSTVNFKHLPIAKILNSNPAKILITLLSIANKKHPPIEKILNPSIAKMLKLIPIHSQGLILTIFTLHCVINYLQKVYGLFMFHKPINQ